MLGGEVLLAVAAITVAAFSVISYPKTSKRDPGLTSEMALFATVLLGALALRQSLLAAGLSVVVAILLAARTILHRFLAHTISEQELHDALLFAAASLIILPLMPDRSLGVYGVFNPRSFWAVVVIVMAISGLGYIALRAMGPQFGLALSGLVGGFASATATIASMAKRATDSPHNVRGCVAGAVLSSVATIIQMVIVLLAVNKETTRVLAISLLFAGVTAIAYGVLFVYGSAVDTGCVAGEQGRAFSLKTALIFAVTLCGVMFISVATLKWLGGKGLALAAGLTGIADAHAAAISVALLVKSGKIAAQAATIPILAALTTNTATKAVMAILLGPKRFFLKVLPGLLLMIVAAWLGLLLK
jgi:uncharacterized membrane protein (DUF4010 family)